MKSLEAGAPTRQLHAQADCTFHLPAVVGDYTDFYASIHHATNVREKLFRPDNPLSCPTTSTFPIAYHGRASSLVVSGTAVRRPNGQLAEGKFGPTRELDYEVEIGAFLGPGNALGEPIPVGEARAHVAGVCLVNDWSARDVQRWEYQPLGPFLAKNFATSVSPWVVTAEAARARSGWTHPRTDDSRTAVPARTGGQSRARPHRGGVAPHRDGARTGAPQPRRGFKEMYWTLGQMVAHHTSNGCPIRPGDLIASGTVSGPAKENRGCLLELTSKGTDPVRLPDGTTRTFLEDGDEPCP